MTETATALLAAFLPLGLLLLMFVVGLRLRLADLAAVLAAPGALALGLAVQLLTLPLAAAAIAVALGLPGPMAAGLLLVAAAPGGISSNYIAHLARADLALSAAMTLATTSLAGLTLPAVMAAGGALLGIGAVLPETAALVRMSLGMAAVGTGPMLAGMAFAAWRPGAAARTGAALEPAAKAVFVAMVLATFVQNREAMRAELASVGLACLLLNLAALALGWTLPRLFGHGPRIRRAVMIEASLQNVAVAIFVAGAILGEPVLAVPGLIYALVMNLTALAVIGASRRGRAAAPGADAA